MDVFAGVVLASAALLVAAGAPKLLDPASTVTALRAVGWRRVRHGHARALAAVEVVVGAGAIIDGRRWWVAGVAVLYAGFTGFLLIALRRRTASCGCAGARETPPTVAHLIMNAVVLSVVAAVAIAGTSTGLVAVADDSSVGELVALLGYAGLTTWLGWVVLAVLPTVQPRAVTRTRSGTTG